MISIIFITLLLFCYAIFVLAIRSEHRIKSTIVDEVIYGNANLEKFEHSAVIKHPACGFTPADWEKFDEKEYTSIFTIWTWCNEMFGRDNWNWHDGRFCFRHERDQTIFLLRWL